MKAKHTTVRPRKQTKQEIAMESDALNILCEGRENVLNMPGRHVIVHEIFEYLKESDILAELAWCFWTMKR